MTAVRVHIATFEYKDPRFGWYEIFADQTDLGSSDVEAYAAHNAIFFADFYLHPNLNGGETWHYWVRAVFDHGDSAGNLIYLGAITLVGGDTDSDGGGGGGLSAPIGAAYVVVAPNDVTLTNERALTAGAGITLTDHGANDILEIAATIAADNPSATASDVAVNGTATTYMRSDAAPAVQKASATQFGVVKVDGSTITATGGVISSSGATFANPTATAKDTAVNGTATTAMRSDAAPAIQKASTSQFGICKPDGSTITSSSGVLSATGAGAGGGSGIGWFSPTMQRMTYVCVNSTTTVGGIGDPPLTVGSVNSSGTLNLGITGSTSAAAGLGSNGAWYHTADNPNVCMCLSLSQTTNVRAWFGLSDQGVSTMTGSDAPAGNYIGFRFSSAVPDTHWVAECHDGSALTTADTGVAVSTSVRQKFAMVITTAAVKFYINGTLVATITTNIPTSLTQMGYGVGLRSITSTGATMNFGFLYIFVDDIA